MKIVQIVPELHYGDAVGNEVLSIHRGLKSRGYETGIYSYGTDARISEKTGSFKNIPDLGKNDILIYHMATASGMSEYVKKQNCIRVLRYHNITPPFFFHGYDANAEKACRNGLSEIRSLKDSFDLCLVDSGFNGQDLRSYGFTGKIRTVPILLSLDDYAKPADEETYRKYRDGKTNILFVGRIAPNKKIENVIAAFTAYQRGWNRNSRLLIVGNYNEGDPYYSELHAYAEMLKAENVEFTGHIPFSGILACYKASDLYVSLSEHEGFCVPLVEAMCFRKPIIAYGVTAVPQTMGPGTLAVSSNDPQIVAGMMNRVLSDGALREAVLNNQDRKLRTFDYTSVLNELIGQIESLRIQESV